MAGITKDDVVKSLGLSGKDGVAVPNMWITIGAYSQSTAKSKQADKPLAKAQQLLDLKEKISREIDPSIVGGMFASGELAMGLVSVKILREGSLAEVVNSLATGQIIPQITVYRTTVIQGKDQEAEKIQYFNCVVTEYNSDMDFMASAGHQSQYTASFSFRPTKRVQTITPYDAKTGKPQGKKVSQIDFVKVGLGGGK